MDRMNPPPNYYGAMYPNSSMNNTPYPNNPNVTPPTPYEGNTSESQGTSQEPSTDDSYMQLGPSVKTIKDFYSEFKKLISPNIGDTVKIYCAFTDSSLWHDKVFEGTLIAAADNYLLIKEKGSNKYTAIASVYIIFIEYI